MSKLWAFVSKVKKVVIYKLKFLLGKGTRFCAKCLVVYSFFLRKLVRQRRTEVTSFCMQFEKIGHGLLWEAFWSEGVALKAEREGEIRKYQSWKTEVNIGVLCVNKNKCSVSNSVCCICFYLLKVLQFSLLFSITTDTFSFLPYLSAIKATPPSLQKASHNNPHPSFQNACKMALLRCIVA